jgi:hypothetical protein
MQHPPTKAGAFIYIISYHIGRASVGLIVGWDRDIREAISSYQTPQLRTQFYDNQQQWWQLLTWFHQVKVDLSLLYPSRMLLYNMLDNIVMVFGVQCCHCVACFLSKVWHGLCKEHDEECDLTMIIHIYSLECQRTCNSKFKMLENDGAMLSALEIAYFNFQLEIKKD